MIADLRRDGLAHVLALSPGWYETAQTGDVMSRLTTDTTLIEQIVGTSVSLASATPLMFVGGVAMLVITSPRLPMLALAVVPLAVVPIIVLGRRVRRLSRQSQERIAEVGVYAGETLEAVRTVQAFGHEEPAKRSASASLVEAAFDSGPAAHRPARRS